MNKQVQLYILITLSILLFKCGSQTSEINETILSNSKDSTNNDKQFEQIKNKFLIGMWKIDSIADNDVNNNVRKSNDFSGFLFTNDGFGFALEKNEKKIKPIKIGNFNVIGDLIEISPSFINISKPPYVTFKFIEVSVNNIILITLDKPNDPNKMKPIYFMTRYVE